MACGTGQGLRWGPPARLTSQWWTRQSRFAGPKATAPGRPKADARNLPPRCRHITRATNRVTSPDAEYGRKQSPTRDVTLVERNFPWPLAPPAGVGTKRPSTSGSVGLALQQPYGTVANPGKPRVFTRSTKGGRAGQPVLCQSGGVNNTLIRKRSEVQVLAGPPRDLHTSPVSMLTLGRTYASAGGRSRS
jgi:hypothetical protein